MNVATAFLAVLVPLSLNVTAAGGVPVVAHVYTRVASPPSSAPRTLRFVVVAVTGLGVADAGVATVGAAFGGPDAFTLNATIWARYRWAAPKV